MEYQEALSIIHTATRLGSQLGLERIRRLCGLLGHPQDSLRFVHVAGTNGKGSTVLFFLFFVNCAGEEQVYGYKAGSDRCAAGDAGADRKTAAKSG